MTDLIGTLETPGEFDALTSLRPEEPYFLLVGRDRLAPALVQKWADDNRARALAEFSAGTINEERRDRELRKSTQAEAIGWAMQSFKAGDMAKKVVGEPTAKTYSGFELDEETARRDKLQSLRIKAVSALNGAVAECAELELFAKECQLVSTFSGATELAEMRQALNNLITKLRQTSELVTPKRPIAA